MLPVAIGALIDQRFLLTEFVAEGGMSTVFRARDLQRSETVAIKILRGHDTATLQRFQREARVLHELTHPNIVRYVAHGVTADGAPYLAMEWLSGEDLAARLSRGPLAVSEVIELGAAIAGALHFAHRQGVIHRDIKPGNVFLVEGKASLVRLLDFGIARPFSADSATRTGTILGTPDYMAPEQVRGGREVDARSDLFSLGCVLYECLAGRPPFASEQMMGVFAKILFEPAPEIATLRRDVPSPLRLLLNRLLDKERERRPVSAESVLLELLAMPQVADETDAQAQRSGERSAHAALTTHEQRLLSVVIAAGRPINLIDAPTLSASMERDLMSAAAGLGAPFGARIESLPDGTLLALLSDQPTAFDQARQAARLALRLRERCRKLFAGDAQSQGVRIAVCTGRGDWQQGILDTGAIERSLNLLSTMTATEAGNEAPIVLDEVTRGLLDGRFLTRDNLLLAERSANEATLALPARQTPFFGRERELDLLLTLLGDSIEEERARAVVLVGDAGLGKSRLCVEFLRRAQLRHEHLGLWSAHGDLLSTASPFGMLAQSVRRALTLREDESNAATQLVEYVHSRVPAAEQGRVLAFLRELLGIPLPAGEPTAAGPALLAARLDPQLMGDQIRRAVLDLLEGESTRQPVVWVLEDLQWSDQPTVRLIDMALRRLAERPFFVLALARPNVHEIFPRLWEGRDVQEIRLSSLPRRASEKISRAVLGPTAPSELVAGVVERAAGNPFFLEELLRAAEAGVLHEVPETVLALVQSRVERLPPDARRVLRAACIFGMVFWRGGVARLLGDSVSAPQLSHWLQQLTQAELINQRPTSHIVGDEEYAFAHTLVREAAHAMLTEQDRALGHHLAAEYLQDSGELDAAALAEHWERSDKPERAIAGYVRAAWQALEGNDLDVVIRHAERAIACGATHDALGEIWAVQAEAYMWRGDHESALKCGNEALTLLPQRSTRWYQVIGVLAIAAGRHSNSYELQRLCDLLREQGEAGECSDAYIIAATRTTMQLFVVGDYPRAIALFKVLQPFMEAPAGDRAPATAAMMHMLRGSEAAIGWQYDQVPLHFERAGDLFEAIGDLRNACSQRLDAAIFLLDTADYPKSEVLLRQVIEISDRLGFHRLSSVAHRALASLLRRTHRPEECIASAQRAIDLSGVTGDLRVSGSAQVVLAQLYLSRGELVHASDHIEKALVNLNKIPRYLARALAVQSRICVLRGDLAGALRSSAQGYAILQALTRLGTDEVLVRSAYAEVLERLGEEAAAQDVLRSGRERLLEQAAAMSDAAVRERFLGQSEFAEFLRRTASLKAAATPPASVAAETPTTLDMSGRAK